MGMKTLSGWSLIAVALLVGFYNMTDQISDLQDWHGAMQPSVVGPALKSFIGPVVAALGGSLLPQLGRKG